MTEFILRKPKVVFDVECNPNCFHIGFKALESKKVIQIEIYGEHKAYSKEEIKKIRKLMTSYTVMGFNSNAYDIPVIKKAIDGATCKELFEMSQKLINDRIPGWRCDKVFDLPQLRCTHIDIFQPSPGVNISLKKYGARLHSQKLQDLPYEFDKHLTLEEHEENKKYNINDLDTTIDLYNEIEKAIELRYIMSDEYKIDLMSLGDAQIAEKVMIAELLKKGIQITAFKPAKDYVIKYKPPECVSFKTELLQNLFEDIKKEEFVLHEKTKNILLPKWLSKAITINDTKFKVGIGGLHSQEKCLVALSDKDYIIKNCDVASYYPSMIVEFGFYPKNIGKVFLEIYSNIKKGRLEAKSNGNKPKSESLKIVLNATFGKMGSKWSKLFAPELMLHITLTGQLLLLQLIEEMDLAGVEILSSNTDGIEYRVLRSREAEIEEMIDAWSNLTGMVMEHGTYKALYARDVNNYVAIYDSEPKAKGCYSKADIKKDSEFQIVYTAIRDYLYTGTPIEDTINNCNDVREFIVCKNVAGGGEWRGQKLGKVVRWIYSAGGEAITYSKESKKGHKVATSDFAVPIMDLPENNEVPDYLDRKYYIHLAMKHLGNLGVDYFDDSMLVLESEEL